MKRVISVLLSVVMIFSAVSVAVTADDGGNAIVNFLADGLGFFKRGFNNSTLHMRPTDNPDVEEFCVYYERNDGSQAENGLGAFYNSVTGEVYGYNYDKGVFDTGFSYNAHSKTFYATKDCWQRQFGFTPLFDLLAKIAFDYVTKRIYFEYDGKEWMIQIWKGNYGFDLFVGGEVGVYNRPDGTFGLHYNCVTDEEMMPISINVHSDEREYFDREAYPTWWATGFVMTDPVDPDSLTLETSIQFPSEEMCEVFTESAESVRGIEILRVEDTVFINW